MREASVSTWTGHQGSKLLLTLTVSQFRLHTVKDLVFQISLMIVTTKFKRDPFS